MEPRAVVQGEIHVAQRDKRNLFNQCNENTDALFIEGRSRTIKAEYATLGYAFFLIGYLSIELVYLSVSKVESLLPSRESWLIEDAADEKGLNVHNEIDAELHEMWDLTDGRDRLSLFFIPVIMLFLIAWHVVSGNQVYLIPDSLFPTVVLAGTPLIYTGLAIFSLTDDEARDDIMANSINEVSEEEGYSEILVLCGDKHVPGIAERMEEKGWEVEENRSTHPLARLLRFISSPLP